MEKVASTIDPGSLYNQLVMEKVVFSGMDHRESLFLMSSVPERYLMDLESNASKNSNQPTQA
uniref:Uncharacterized protein n=1 Tax=Nelumbo nucifera TaxID=4432 RepID=A0A822YTY1_NELNU|nr:TPA_asm: hypothetical protein HUJ06_006610 [Nelumbo nucifera]